MSPEDKLITKHVKTINKQSKRIAKLEEAVEWWQEVIRLPLTEKSTTVWTVERVVDMIYKNEKLEAQILEAQKYVTDAHASKVRDITPLQALQEVTEYYEDMMDDQDEAINNLETEIEKLELLLEGTETI